jgi:hypothetical protein
MHRDFLWRSASFNGLGMGIDQVVGDGRILNEAEEAALTGHRWRVWKGRRPGQRTYRVPISGSLVDIEGVHRSFLERVDGKQYRPPHKLKKYDSLSCIREATLQRRSWAVFELPEGVASTGGHSQNCGNAAFVDLPVCSGGYAPVPLRGGAIRCRSYQGRRPSTASLLLPSSPHDRPCLRRSHDPAADDRRAIWWSRHSRPMGAEPVAQCLAIKPNRKACRRVVRSVAAELRRADPQIGRSKSSLVQSHARHSARL